MDHNFSLGASKQNLGTNHAPLKLVREVARTRLWMEAADEQNAGHVCRRVGASAKLVRCF